MRILHILDHSLPHHSGYVFRTCAILREQEALGWKTFQLTSGKHGEAPELEEAVKGFRFYRTPRSSSGLARWPVFDQLEVVRRLERRLREIAAEVRPDILHAHSPALNGLAAIRLGKRLGLPVVYECRAFWEDAAVDHGSTREGSPRYRLTRRLETYVLKRANAVTTICEGLRLEILERGIAPEKVTVIPNAVHPQRFGQNSNTSMQTRSLPNFGGHVVLGFIGSFYAYEGLAVLLEAIPRILASRPDVRVLLVGGGPHEPFLRQRVRELSIEGSVTFTGRVPHEQVEQYYDLIDIFVYPRLSMRLTEMVTPLKPLEAMAHRRLVVASDVGGHRELIRHGKTGYLFRAGDAEALANAVLNALRDVKSWTRVHDAARAFIESERSWQSSVSRYKSVYVQALHQGALKAK